MAKPLKGSNQDHVKYMKQMDFDYRRIEQMGTKEVPLFEEVIQKFIHAYNLWNLCGDRLLQEARDFAREVGFDNEMTLKAEKISATKCNWGKVKYIEDQVMSIGKVPEKMGLKR